MKEESRFYGCHHCGNLMYAVHCAGVPVICCGEPMEELQPNTTDAAQEKHVPVVTREGEEIRVCVGSTEHPATQEHHIGWIALETGCGIQIKYLDPCAPPKTVFALGKETPLAVYAYCNLHGLWKFVF